LITQDLEDVPFDYRHRRCIEYKTNKLHWEQTLQEKITLTIKAVLGDENPPKELAWPYDTEALRFAGPAGAIVPAEKARDLISRGIAQSRDTLSAALGVHGTTVSVTSPFGSNRAQRSGAAIAAALKSSNPVVQIGMDELRSIAAEVAAAVGDYTKSAALIFSELSIHGFSALKHGASLRDLTHEMDIAVEATTNQLNNQSRPFDMDRAIGIAVSAAQGDRLSGETAEKAFRRAGEDGMVLIAESANANTTLSVREGMHFDRGFITNQFITDEANQLAILDDAQVLLYSGKISSMKSLMPVLEQIARAGKALLIVADDVDGEALATLIANKARGRLASVAVKSPGYIMRQEILEDIAVATGGFVLHQQSSLERADLSQLGSVKQARISKESTLLIEARGNPTAIGSRATGLRQQIATSFDTRESELLQERLAKLVGAVATIHIGGASQLDRDEQKYRINSAIQSLHNARAGGVVLGGGNELWHAWRALANVHQTEGGKIVIASLLAPLRAQIENAQSTPNETLATLGQHDGEDMGFNASTRQIENVREAEILDPTKAVILGLQIAFSHARQAMQTGAWDTQRQPQAVDQRLIASHPSQP
jgi:chaperonin GroEL